MKIRFATPADAAAIAAIYRPIVLETPISFEVAPPSAQEMAQRMQKVTPFAPWLVCELDGQIAGYAYAFRHHEREAYKWCVDASVYIGEAFRRRGVARALYTSLFALLRLQGFVTVCAGITLGNEASVRLHETLGFESVGVYRAVGFKDGIWHDVGWWQLDLGPRPDNPLPTRSPAEIREDPAIGAALRAGEPLLVC